MKIRKFKQFSRGSAKTETQVCFTPKCMSCQLSFPWLSSCSAYHIPICKDHFNLKISSINLKYYITGFGISIEFHLSVEIWRAV